MREKKSARLLITVLSLILAWCVSLQAQELPTSTADMSDDFSDGDFEGWSVDSVDNWEVVDGMLRMKNIVARDSRITYFALFDEGGIAGDFDLTVYAGFKALEMSGSDTLSWTIFYRNLALGIMQDSANALMARLYRPGWDGTGFFKLNGGQLSSFYSRFPGGEGAQGMSFEVNDIIPYRISRKGKVLTFQVNGHLVFQAVDTTPNAIINAGWAAIATGGPFGLVIDRVVLSSTVADPPVWGGPVSENKNKFTFLLDEGNGVGVTDKTGRYWGLAEGGSNGSSAGSRFGWWAEDGVVEGNRSFASNVGSLGIFDVTLNSSFTLEAWIKLTRPGCPIFYLMMNGKAIDPEWSSRLRGGLISEDGQETGAADLYLDWAHKAVSERMKGVLPLDVWTHVAWVRKDTLNTVYIGGEAVGSMGDEIHGNTAFSGAFLAMGNNADHDWVRAFAGEPYLYIDMLRLSPWALEPEDFHTGAPDSPEPVPTVRCDFNSDGAINIIDVIALLIFQRENPGDPLGDFNHDGTVNITDAIAMLLAQRDGTCSDSN
ncbi:MAG: LamG-like jellyroll fold domain-containing protein [Gemmatimonadota bacterium]|nr:LamG-like jellyroll fold domain-containing protein [Gemmatimonadota bacterium]